MPSRSLMGATGLFLSTWDLAKFGQMCLDGGIWEGKRLVSKEWLDIPQAAKESSPTTDSTDLDFPAAKTKPLLSYIRRNVRADPFFSLKASICFIAWTCHDENGSTGILTKILRKRIMKRIGMMVAVEIEAVLSKYGQPERCEECCGFK